MKRQLKEDKGQSSEKFTVVNGIRHNQRISIDWTSEEQSVFEYLLNKYSSEVPAVQYANIAQALPDKTVRDVTLRIGWMMKKKNGKRGDIPNTGIFSNKSIVGDTSERLIERNARVLDQIDANFSDLKIQENFGLLSEARENLVTLLNDLTNSFHNGMPPFPFKINQQLADSILPPPSPPKK